MSREFDCPLGLACWQCEHLGDQPFRSSKSLQTRELWASCDRQHVAPLAFLLKLHRRRPESLLENTSQHVYVLCPSRSNLHRCSSSRSSWQTKLHPTSTGSGRSGNHRSGIRPLRRGVGWPGPDPVSCTSPSRVFGWPQYQGCLDEASHFTSNSAYRRMGTPCTNGHHRGSALRTLPDKVPRLHMSTLMQLTSWALCLQSDLNPKHGTVSNYFGPFCCREPGDKAPPCRARKQTSTSVPQRHRGTGDQRHTQTLSKKGSEMLLRCSCKSHNAAGHRAWPDTISEMAEAARRPLMASTKASLGSS